MEWMILINTIEIKLWDRAFSLQVSYEMFEDETITAAQKSAVKMLAMHPEWIVSAKARVECFCKEQVLADNENNRKDNIFSYIKPEYLFVKREDHPRVALMCKYRYDMEHGLAVVFAADGGITVGIQDIIL